MDDLGLRQWLGAVDKGRRFLSVGDPRLEKQAGMFAGASAFVTFKVVSVDMRKPGRVVEVRRRFSDFVALRESLLRRHTGLVLPVPEAGILNGAMVDPMVSRATMTARRERGLAAFCDALCGSPFLARDAVTIAFFELAPYSAWDALRNVLGNVGDARSAEQAVERAGDSVGGTAPLRPVDMSGQRRWEEALASKAVTDIDAEALKRFAAAKDVEKAALNASKAARVVAQTAHAHAIAVSKLSAALSELGRCERDAFRGRDKAFGADPLEALVADVLKPVEEESATRSDLVERYIGAPLREESAHMTALRLAAKAALEKEAKKKDNSDSALPNVPALRLEAERLPARFAIACERAALRFGAGMRATSADLASVAPQLVSDVCALHVADNELHLAISLAGHATKDASKDHAYGFLRGDNEAAGRRRPKSSTSRGNNGRGNPPEESPEELIPKPSPTASPSLRKPPPRRRPDLASEPAAELTVPTRKAPAPPRPAAPSPPRPAGPSFLADIRSFDNSKLSSTPDDDDDDDNPFQQPKASSGGGGLMAEMMARRRAHMADDD